MSVCVYRDLRAKLEVAINKTLELAALEAERKEEETTSDTDDYSSDSEEVNISLV